MAARASFLAIALRNLSPPPLLLSTPSTRPRRRSAHLSIAPFAVRTALRRPGLRLRDRVEDLAPPRRRRAGEGARTGRPGQPARDAGRPLAGAARERTRPSGAGAARPGRAGARAGVP